MLRGLAIGLCLLGAASAADIDYPDFTSTKDLFIIHDAQRAKNVLRLTDAIGYQRGGAWYRVKQPVVSGFDTTFTFQFTEQDTRVFRGGDGLAFVVQNESLSAMGGAGASGGFMRSAEGARTSFERGIVNRLAVFFDTYANQWDISGNYVAVCTSGREAQAAWPPHCAANSKTLPMDLKDGRPHTARIVYHPPKLAVFVDGAYEALRMESVDLADLVGGDGTAWVGFTAATSAAFERHDLLSWHFEIWSRGGTSSATPPPAAPPARPGTVAPKTATTALQTPVPCLPDRKLCTLERAVVQEKGPGEYHVYLPANLEWGVSVPNPQGGPVRVHDVKGMVCWDPQKRDTTGCNGPEGNGAIPAEAPDGGAPFVAPRKPAGSLVARVLNGRVWFSVNGRSGDSFGGNEGFFEFDVSIPAR